MEPAKDALRLDESPLWRVRKIGRWWKVYTPTGFFWGVFYDHAFALRAADRAAWEQRCQQAYPELVEGVRD